MLLVDISLDILQYFCMYLYFFLFLKIVNLVSTTQLEFEH